MKIINPIMNAAIVFIDALAGNLNAQTNARVTVMPWYQAALRAHGMLTAGPKPTFSRR